MRWLIFFCIVYICYVYMTDYLVEGEVYQSKVKFINKGKFHCRTFDSEISCVDTSEVTLGELKKDELYDQ